MNISLVYINPPKDHYYTPLALGYLKSMVSKEPSLQNVQIDIEEFKFNDENKYIIDKLTHNKPLIIGFSCYVWNINKIKNLSHEIKKILPNTIILLGGPQAADLKNNFYNGAAFVDIILEGEAELTFLELVKGVNNNSFQKENFKGISYFGNDGKIKNQERELIKNIDDIPSPYLTKSLNVIRNRFMPIETARGCPYKCSFCFWHKDFGPVRFFSLERIFKELEFMFEKGINKLNILDAVFNINEKRAIDICKKIYSINKDNTRVFADIRPELMTDKLGYWLSKANIKTLYIGLQSINPDALKNANRKNDLKKIARCIEITKKYDIKSVIQIINGLPGDTPEGVKKTIDFAKSLNPTNVAVYKLYILPGTEFFNNAKKFGIEYDKSYLQIKNNSFSEEELINLQEYAIKFTEEHFSETYDTLKIN